LTQRPYTTRRYPLYANREIQQELIDNYFAPKSHLKRIEKEREIAELLAKETKSSCEVILYCPNRSMQLKEAHIHVLFPGEPKPKPLSSFGGVSRLKDLNDSYKNLWKFYVLALTDELQLLKAIQKIASKLLHPAVNVYSLD
jgi:hypothetical protein